MSLARHISMKCHFSPCGHYLHLVSLEAQQRLPSKVDKEARNKPFLTISAFISTHRLSTRKTARSPPVLIHRAKVSLGSTQSLNPNVLPAEITWTSRHVYLSAASREKNLLSLLRIELFPLSHDGTSQKDSGGQNQSITVPRLPIFLPESAQSRKVHYFPPAKPCDTTGLIFLGSWACDPLGKSQTLDGENEAVANAASGHPERVSPPIGFYVNEKDDLGGWIPSNASVQMDSASDKGMLKAKNGAVLRRLMIAISNISSSSTQESNDRR